MKKPPAPSVKRRRPTPVIRTRVKVTYAPDKVAYLIIQGEQVSLIHWQHNGIEQYISNKFIKKMTQRIRL